MSQPKSQSQPHQPRPPAIDSQVAHFREIGISAVAGAKAAGRSPVKSPAQPSEAQDIPAILRTQAFS